MIPLVASLTTRERVAVAELIRRVHRLGEPRLERALLFGSKARGDFDANSDVDVLLVCDMDPDDRFAVSDVVGRIAERLAAETGILAEPWTVAVADLAEGNRTPMLVDAIADSVPLWPAFAPPLDMPFTPADALFCADCLLRWVDAGGEVARAALEDGRLADAARRARDDIARLATAALLLSGDTRHRRVSSLRRFEEVFVRSRRVSVRVLPALAWAEAAYPPDGGRGQEDPPVPARAAATAELGCRMAALLEGALLDSILERMDELDAALT